MPDTYQPQSLLSLPLDIIYYIIDFIDEPSDLSRLALTSESLHRFIASNHFYFRRIRFTLGNSDMWSLLKTDVHIASRVRKLELLPNFQFPSSAVSSFLPPLCLDLPYNLVKEEDSVVLFKNALANMIDLTQLVWLVHHTITGEEILEPCLHMLFHKDVRELDVFYSKFCITMNSSLYRAPSPENFMDNLTRVNISFQSYRGNHSNPQLLRANPPNVQKFIDIIMNRCPRLEDLSLNALLRIRYGRVLFSVFAPRIFIDGHWPSLRRLALFGEIICLPEDADLTAKSAILHAFWIRHPNIECLLLGFSQEYVLEIQSGLLPKLKSLSSSMSSEELSVPTDVLAQIEHLCDTSGPRGSSSLRLQKSYLKHATFLKTLIITIMDEHWECWKYWEGLLLNHPTITHFAFRQYHQSYLIPDHEAVNSVLQKLSTLSHLTHLFFADAGLSEGKRDKRLLSTLSQFPKLQYVLGIEPRFDWWVLERNAKGRIKGWSRAKKDLSESLESFNDWGCNLPLVMRYNQYAE